VQTKECLEFWYLLNGVDNGELFIYESLYFLESPLEIKLWNKKSHENDEWRYAQVEVDNAYLNYSIIFEAVKGKNDGMVGVDDITFRIGDCSPAINTGFEDYMLGSWLQFKKDEMDWLLTQGFNYLNKKLK
jgi:hypothetical protein